MNLPDWAKNLHPETIADLTVNGQLRQPHYEEWQEDFGLGYIDRMRFERDKKGLSYMTIENYIKFMNKGI